MKGGLLKGLRNFYQVRVYRTKVDKSAKTAALQLWKEDIGMFDAYHYMMDQVFERDLNKI
jgi:hypothetical protein